VKLKWKWLPPWNMPSDPVKAVYWFLHWFLQVLVRYFFVLIIAGVAYETYLNGIVGLLGTLFIGLVVWALLMGVLVVVNFATKVSQTLEEVNRLSQTFGSMNSFDPFGGLSGGPSGGPSGSPFTTRIREEENVVEGSIITDLEEERRKRRQEM
jgi:hypothetical protein